MREIVTRMRTRGLVLRGDHRRHIGVDRKTCVAVSISHADAGPLDEEALNERGDS